MKDEKTTATQATAKAAETTAAKFTKEQLITAKKFKDRKDALGAVLEDNKTYTVSEAEKLLDNFMKGQVK